MTTQAPSPTRHAADPLPDRLAGGAVPSRSARLLGLVRNLIAFGEALLRTLQAAPAAEALYDITRQFGTRDLRLIVARITRGLMIAAQLDARLLRGATRRDNPPAPAAAVRGADRRARRAPVPLVGQQEDDTTLLACLPTARQIASRLRGKPIGVVLEEICQDLGITCKHPLWQDLHQAILAYGGSLPRALDRMWDRVTAGIVSPADDPDAALPYPQPARAVAATGTGPP